MRAKLKQLIMREVTPADSHFLWELSNEPSIRAASFSSEFISWEDHQKWFVERLADPATIFFVAEDGTGQPLGQCRFKVDGEDATISVSLLGTTRGKGLGVSLICEGVNKLFSCRDSKRVFAYIKPENTISLQVFEKAGFCRMTGDAEKIVMVKER